jgi:crotonobetainyl-CoA:carnitine CoA-transferase CaiB-like acyl-CoA transferase
MGACGKAELHWPKRIAAEGEFGENRTSDAHLEFCGMSILAGLEVAQIGPGLAAAVCGRLFADIGARVTCIAPAPGSTPLACHLNHGKSVMSGDAAAARAAIASAALIVCQGRPRELRSREYSLEALRRINPTAPTVAISPFGQTGPKADDPATDLTLFFASGIARMLTGQVGDLAEAPIRPVGEQSAFIGGIAAACAGMHAVLAGGTSPGAMIDVSIQEALATITITELARAGLSGKSWSRKRLGDGNGATVCILPARDGYAAISPRDEHQWAAWVGVMGSPEWAKDPRFAAKPDRVVNWDVLHALMSDWSRGYDKQAIADMAQAAHVPSFPLREPREQLQSPQLAHRGFWRQAEIGDKSINVPGPPFGLSVAKPEGKPPEREAADHSEGHMPLAGIRVLDFSWVIAGPTATRYLAAVGAEVIKVEAPGRGDPGRGSELHTVLGQAKRGIVLDLKNPDAIAVARALAAKSDVLVENFATGVMDRLGLGADALRAVNPNLVYVSASGLGRTGPEAHAVAYGTLLQCYAGFAGLNRHPEVPPRVGLAWLDPMCGLMLAFVTAAALWHRQHAGGVARIDFSMLEAMLWTMAEPLLSEQLGAPPQPVGNRSDRHAPHGAYRCAGEDDWIGLAVSEDQEWQGLCAVVPSLTALAKLGAAQRREQRPAIDRLLASWARPQAAAKAAQVLLRAGVPAAALTTSRDLVGCEHLRERGFWVAHGAGVLPGLPWRASFGRVSGPAPELGGDTEAVLHDLLGMSPDRIAALRQSGALG